MTEGPLTLGGYRAGTLVAGYRLEAQVGSGGMAAVFRARDQRLNRLVALKILAPAMAADATFRQRFIAESRAAAAVDDPHIIPIYDAGEAGGALFIAMRFVPGGDLRHVLFTDGPLPAGRAADLISPVASALDAAHRAGLVHRDIKPANILVDRREGRPDHVYLSDFGVSKGAGSLTGTGQFLGTPEYSAPEQAKGWPVDGRADQYALACVAWKLLTGTAPFERDQGMAVLLAHTTEPPPPLAAQRPDLPAAAGQVLARALAKLPHERYRTCQDFSEALRAALGLPPYISRAPMPRGSFSQAEQGHTRQFQLPEELTADLHAPALAGHTTVEQGRGNHRRNGPPRRRRYAAIALAAAAAITATVLITMQHGGTSPAAGPATFTNPVFGPDLPDPSIIQDPATKTWYAFGTSDQWTASPSTAHSLPILTSRNLVKWTFLRSTFSPEPAPRSPAQPAWTAGQSLWAPEVRLIHGTYVMYYATSGSATAGQAIGVATAKSPAGPWHDSGGPLIAPQANPAGGFYTTLDPDEIVTPEGQRYLYYGSTELGIRAVPLTASGLAVAPGSTPVQITAPARYAGTNVVYHNGYYYLFATSGDCCAGPASTYEVVVGRSHSPLGPFTDKLGIPLTSGGISVVLAANGDDWVGTGGTTAFQDDAGRWWMALHVVSQHSPYMSSGQTKRSLAIEPIEWGAGGWPSVNDGRGVTDGAQPSPGSPQANPQASPNAPDVLDRVPVPGSELPAYSQDFDTGQLGPQWSWVNEDPANWSVASVPGTLTITGQAGQFFGTEHSGENILLESAPAGNWVAQTRVALSPTQDVQQAGFVLWQGDDTWMKLVAESNDGSDITEWAKQTDVTSPYAGFDCGAGYLVNTCPVFGSAYLEVPGFSPAVSSAGVPGSGGWAYLRMVKNGSGITAYTSLNGQTWTPGATYNLSGFSSSEPLQIGLMATSAGAAPIPASFSYVHVYQLAR